MSAPGPRPDRPRTWPEVAVSALERGDYPTFLDRTYPAIVVAGGADGDAATLLLILRAIAVSMRWQALGRMDKAWRRLGDAARLLPVALCPLRRQQRVPLAVLAPAPGDGGTAMFTWRASRLVYREQQEIILLREQALSREGSRKAAHDLLVDAGAEYLRWGDGDPFVWTGPGAGAPLGLRRTRAEFCDRATLLRRFATATAAEVGPSAWRSVGGYRGLQAAALRQIAACPVAAWQRPDPLTAGIPVRLGRQRTWEWATRWVKDVQRSGR